MDTFPLQRQSFDGTQMIEDPPTSETTGRVIRDPKDPAFVNPERYSFNLNSDSVAVPWET